jgi:hypothetical protein
VLPRATYPLPTLRVYHLPHDVARTSFKMSFTRCHLKYAIDCITLYVGIVPYNSVSSFSFYNNLLSSSAHDVCKQEDEIILPQLQFHQIEHHLCLSSHCIGI